MTGKNPIAKAASAAFHHGFNRGTDAMFLALLLAVSIFAGFFVHALIVKPEVIVATTPQGAIDAGWKCQIAKEARVALCRLPSPAAETPETEKPRGS